MTKNHLSFLSLRYLLTWMGLWTMYGITKLPYAVQLRIGQYLGRCALHVLKHFRHVAYVNLSLCFPELSEIERKVLLRKHFESLGMGLMEWAMAAWMSLPRLTNLLQVEGLEHLQKALEKKHGVLALSGHFTSLELCGRLLTTLIPLHVVYREQKNKLVDSLLKKQRNFEWMHTIHRHSVRQIIKTLRQNGTVWYAADQDYGIKHSIFSPFFNIVTASITIPSYYAKHTRAQVLTIFYYRRSDGKGYTVVISPVLEDFNQLSALEATRYFNRELEHAIRAHPEQYLWIHRRFKTRPPGEPTFY